MNPIKNAVEQQISNLGPSEFALAVSKVENPNNVAAIIEAVTDYRKQFESKYGVINNGAAAFATRDQWEAIGCDAEGSAKRELLKDSSLLREVDELTRKATEARRLADERQAELNRLHAELSSLPDRISATQRELDSLNATLSELNVDTLKADYKRLYRAVLDGGQNDKFAEVFAAAAIVTVDLRREVLTAKTGEIEASLVEMRRRVKELKRRLP
jgi:chromosome segregation ATPase